jgi:hypothetical protein
MSPTMMQFNSQSRLEGGTQYRNYLRHYSTSRKVSGCIPDVIRYFDSPNHFSHTKALKLAQHVTEMSTTNLSGSKPLPAGAICVLIF